MSLFDNIAKVIGLGKKHAGYGVIEGVGDTATQIIKDDDERLNQIFEDIETKSEVGEFTQDEPQQEDQEVEQEQI